MVLCEGDMPTDFELTPEYLPPSGIEPPCPGLDVCPVAMCGCRWLSQNWPWKPEPPPDDPEATLKSTA